jgi:hypothetical protein
MSTRRKIERVPFNRLGMKELRTAAMEKVDRIRMRPMTVEGTQVTYINNSPHPSTHPQPGLRVDSQLLIRNEGRSRIVRGEKNTPSRGVQ